MKLECVGKGFVYTWPGGAVSLEPGKPIDLPDERAKRLLKKVGNRVRQVPPSTSPMVTWDRAGVCQQGVIDWLYEAVDGSLWAFVTLPDGTWAAVNAQLVTRVTP